MPNHGQEDEIPFLDRKLRHSTTPSFSYPPSEIKTLHDHEADRTTRFSLLSPRVYWPASILLMQSTFFIGGWLFFAATGSGPMPLQDSLAELARDHAQSVTLIVTLIATILSITSGFLYSCSVRYSLTSFLTRPVSLFAIASTIRIAQRSPIVNFARIKWTIAGLVCTIAAAIQTAGWSTLLTPVRIELTMPMQGFEINLAHPAVKNLLTSNINFVTPDVWINVLPSIDSSGSAAAAARSGLPAMLNFDGISYMNSTGGILPANLVPMESGVAGLGYHMPANTQKDRSRYNPNGFPTSYSMIQQGFTAVVMCQQRELNLTTSPALDVVWENVTALNRTLILSQMLVQCPGDEEYTSSFDVVTEDDVISVFAVVCPVATGSREGQYDIIFKGAGLYDFINTTICAVLPQVTTVNVDYSDSSSLFNMSWPSFVNISEPLTRTPAPEVGEITVAMFQRALWIAQSLTANTMGNSLSALFYNQPGNPNALNEVLQDYLRGILEFSATLVRGAYTVENNNLFPPFNASVIPQDMRFTTSGTYFTETIGWSQSTETAPIVLLGPTFMTLTSIIIVLLTLIRTSGYKPPKGAAYFDPGNILHVVAAASAGGMEDPFPTFREDVDTYGQEILVKLGTIDDQKLGFVRDG